ncbi:hypothetical protein O6H91_08G081100 [Diphasiastrum complanatum]|uniref:Uncharacterized protein n=1 Tax=Diphasiastrum complanatum TaxID=34168 RepID=A0ACC2CZA6_DIPCM|nr:hypothetical protein O6H91_08G081100 [Diphasiastrum complanatum]
MQEIVEEDQSPIEQVALTVSTTDDPSMPVYTFRMWTIGIVSCILLAFVNQFFAYRTEPLTVSAISVQIASMPLGHFMANILPKKRIKFPGTNWHFSLNPGPFNMKEHVLITIFANAGAGGAYAISIVNIVKAFYKHKISFYVALVITVTTQSLGYGWAGIFRKYLVDPAHMWWPSNLVQVSLFRVLHEKDSRSKGGLTRMQFFLMIITISFCYYSLPGYLFPMLTSLSWVCWAWPNSITAHQIGSGLHGLGVGAVGLDWATISSFIGSPLATPWFAIANVMVGFLFVMYVITPAVYWGNVYDAKTFPIFSSALFSDDGQRYNFTRVIDHNFRLDIDAYNNYSRLRGSAFFMFSYGVGFAALTATVSHVMLFHGRDIWQRYKAALKNDKPDIHTRLMKQYKAVPESWFLGLLVATVVVSILVCELVNDQVQLRWWGVLLACGIALSFTLPIGVIAATTNQVPGLNLITEMIIGYLYPGRPVANVSFKTYGYISMTQAVSFLSDFKLGHYMKIPPRSMFIVQVLGTLIAAVVNLSTAWWLLTSIHDICNTELLPSNSPWTCPGDAVFFDASIIWGLIGPKRVFGSLGMYNKLNWFFLFGALAPVPVWLLSKAFPHKTWIRSINMPVLIGASGIMPPASSVNFTAWFVVGFIFNYIIFKYRKGWWQRHNYVLSAALDAGLAFMGVVLYATTGLENKSITWWGTNLDNCPLASCPTAPGIVRDGCPLVS